MKGPCNVLGRIINENSCSNSPTKCFIKVLLPLMRNSIVIKFQEFVSFLIRINKNYQLYTLSQKLFHICVISPFPILPLLIIAPFFLDFPSKSSIDIMYLPSTCTHFHSSQLLSFQLDPAFCNNPNIDESLYISVQGAI